MEVCLSVFVSVRFRIRWELSDGVGDSLSSSQMKREINQVPVKLIASSQPFPVVALLAQTPKTGLLCLMED